MRVLLLVGGSACIRRGAAWPTCCRAVEPSMAPAARGRFWRRCTGSHRSQPWFAGFPARRQAARHARGRGPLPVPASTLRRARAPRLQVNMSVAVIPMAKELGWSAMERGLVSSSFFWGYSLTQIPAGWVSTRCNGRRAAPPPPPTPTPLTSGKGHLRRRRPALRCEAGAATHARCRQAGRRDRCQPPAPHSFLLCAP